MKITDKADFPNSHPGNARGDNSGVVHVPGDEREAFSPGTDASDERTGQMIGF